MAIFITVHEIFLQKRYFRKFLFCVRLENIFFLSFLQSVFTVVFLDNLSETKIQQITDALQKGLWKFYDLQQIFILYIVFTESNMLLNMLKSLNQAHDKSVLINFAGHRLAHSQNQELS